MTEPLNVLDAEVGTRTIGGFVVGASPAAEMIELRRILKLPLEERRIALMARHEKVMEQAKQYFQEWLYKLDK